ncbi:MAG: hypothetical protein JXB03_07365 [Spirochaetales bacterium]|nr:hypothetical protein [Spirochaetales bacterium]
MMHTLDTKTPSRYFFVIVLYLLLIGTLLYLQFGSSIPFHDSYKSLEIQGKKRAGATAAGLSEIRVEYGMFSVAFNDAKPLVFHYENSARAEQKSFQVSGYAKFPDRLEIRFNSGVILYFEEQEGNISLGLETEEVIPAVMEIPFYLRHPEELIVSEGFPVIQHPSKSSKEGYFVRLSSGSVIDQGAGCLRIKPPTDRNLLTIENSEAESIITYWFSTQPVSVSASEFTRKLRDYFQKSFYGWKTGRYNADTGTWRANSGTVFTEDLINAYGAQSFILNDGETFLNRIIPQASQRPELTYLSNPFLGDIVTTGSSLVNDAQEARDLARTGLIQNTGDAFLLMRFADLYSKTRMEQLASTLESKINSQEDPSIAALYIYVYFQLFGTENPAVFKKIEDLILPCLTPHKNGYVLESLDGVSDTFIGILAGSVLSAQTRQPLYSTIGKSIILTYLSMADTTGRIPRELVRGVHGWTIGTEFMLPEEVYPVLAPKTYYPKTVKLDAEMWAWTNAENVSSVARGSQIHIQTEFPVNGVHHISIANVEPFSGIKLYGIPWKSDPQFQRYSSGWVYDLDTKTLFLKIRQRKPVETIVIDYAPIREESPSAAVDTPVSGISIIQ